MTYRGALLSVLDGIQLSDSAIEKALIDAGYTGEETYSIANGAEIDLMAISVLQLASTVKRVTEGGYTIEYDTAAIKERLAFLLRKNELEVTSEPKVRNRSYLW